MMGSFYQRWTNFLEWKYRYY